MKPIAFLDLESTGLDTANDAIFDLAIYEPDREVTNQWLIKPWKPIPPEVEKLTGRTNADVAKCPTFKELAGNIHAVIQGCDVAGFNCARFDVPLLWEELYRAGITWDLKGVHIIDHGTIMKKMEARTLTAAVKFYCGIDHEGAHGALADCIGTRMVATGQMIKYPQMFKMTRAELAKFSEHDGPVPLTFDGKIAVGPDGDAIYTFGTKTKGVKVRDDLGFAYWILGKDFPAQTKLVLRKLLEKYEEEENSDTIASNDKHEEPPSLF